MIKLAAMRWKFGSGLFLLGICVTSFALFSCGNKEELHAKLREQQKVIEHLEATLEKLDSKPEEPLPPDRSLELEETMKKLEAAKGDLEVLKGQVERLEMQKAKLEKQFNDYRRKYQVRPSSK